MKCKLGLPSGLSVGSLPDPVIGTTKDYSGHITTLITADLRALTVGGVDLVCRVLQAFESLGESGMQQ